MKRLGYYAKDKDNTLYQFKWEKNDTFYILKQNGYETANSKDYEILEIGFYTDEK